MSDLERSEAFYEKVLAPLELTLLVQRELSSGFGKKYPEFWLNARPGMPPVLANTGNHICLRAPTNEAVTQFHAVAIANGGRDAGAPGPRQAAMTTYYGAFIFDPDGNKLEATCFPKAGVSGH